jgi:predicted flap endonuclease-1-like 5' DNA nuclease
MIAAEALGGKTDATTVTIGVAAEEPIAAKPKKVKKEAKATVKKSAKVLTKKTSKKEAKNEDKAKDTLSELLGVSAKIAQSLEAAGIKNAQDILKLSAEGLTQIKGIGEKTAEKIMLVAKKIK